MSYPLILVHFHNGDEVPVERSVIMGVLSPYKYTPDVLETPDGGGVELTLHESDDGNGITSCHFHLHFNSLTPQVIDCIFQMAIAGDMVIMPEQPTEVILVNPSQEAHLPDPDEIEWEPRLCRTARELQAVLTEA